MSTTEAWTVGKLLEWTTDYLKKNGSENPRLDAEVLLATAKKCERIVLYTSFNEEVPEDVRGQFRGLVKQRAEGVPVAYLVGEREFYSLDFKVTPDVLIPRPETEFVVIAVLDELKRRPAGSPPAEVADVGTGSGAIAVTVAKHAPDCHLIAIDLSAAALAVAQENAATHQVAGRIQFLESDLLAKLPPQAKFDIIASNPPYIGEVEMPTLSPQVKNHEPKMALVGGLHGTEIIARLIPQAAERLKVGGLLTMEFSPIVAAAVVELIAADGRFSPAIVTKDLAGLARVVQARRLANA